MILRHQTKAAFLARLRADYAASQGERAARLSTLILEWIADGSFTDAEMRAGFGKTAAQWATFKTQAQQQANALASVRNARGQA